MSANSDAKRTSAAAATPCAALRPALLRLADGDGTPEDGLLAARHMEGCTACRIVLARERRIAAIVADLPEPIDVDENFVDHVMARIPMPEPLSKRAALARVAKRAARNGLKLATVFAGPATALVAARALWVRFGSAFPVAGSTSEFETTFEAPIGAAFGLARLLRDAPELALQPLAAGTIAAVAVVGAWFVGSALATSAHAFAAAHLSRSPYDRCDTHARARSV